MATEYDVRTYCEDCEEKKFATRDTDENGWIPAGCEEHTIRDFVVIRKREVA